MDYSTSPSALVSVVVCVRNRPDQVRGCLTSLLASSHKPLEIIVVDDASTDDTPLVVCAMAEDAPAGMIKLVKNSTNLGVSGARNAGIRAASGEFIFFTDSDCLVEPDWAAQLLQALQGQQASAVCGMVRDPEPRNLSELSFFGNLTLKPGRMQNRRLAGCNMGFRAAVIRTFLFDEQLTYGCDEDDVARRMESAGHRFALADTASVLHRHPMTYTAYMRQAWRQGVGSARYWFKYGQYLGRDVLFGVLAFLTLPLIVFDERLVILPTCLMALQLMAVWANEWLLKGLPLLLSLQVLPVAVSYNLVKTWSVVTTLLRIFMGKEPAAWKTRVR